MKNVQTQAAQGDILVRRVKSIPSTAVAVSLPADGRHVVAHSETGHHHVVEGEVRYLRTVDTGDRDDTGPTAGMVAYLEVLSEHADVVHLRDFDTHETLRLPAGLWEIRRQREWAPEGWRRVED